MKRITRLSLVFALVQSVTSFAANELELFAELPQAVGNIAYADNADLIFSNHPFYNPAIRVLRFDHKTKTTKPFPNLSWNTPRKSDDNWFDSILGLRTDSKGVVWILDMGQRAGLTPKLVGWDTVTDKLVRIYYLPKPVSLPTSQHNDFVIDEKHNVFIIADEDIGHGGDGTKAALIIIDMKTGKTRRILQGHETTRPELVTIVVEGKPLNIPNSDKPIRVGVDGITTDLANEWLYYGPLSGSQIYRVKVEDVLNESLTEKALSQKIEKYATKENNGGLSIDVDGNLYTTNIESHSIGFIDAKTRKNTHFVSDKRMVWPDGVSYNKDGYMYISASQISKASVFNNGKDFTTKPFQIFRFKPKASG
ncbi:MAG: hypothetical protein KAG98_03800, partial [Lentisphaeria bacterium]|nr:hypothetical protein [Lentisphaeria bacterium]